MGSEVRCKNCGWFGGCHANKETYSKSERNTKRKGFGVSLAECERFEPVLTPRKKRRYWPIAFGRGH